MLSEDEASALQKIDDRAAALRAEVRCARTDGDVGWVRRADSSKIKRTPTPQGHLLEALEMMERGLVLRQHLFGARSEQVRRAVS